MESVDPKIEISKPVAPGAQLQFYGEGYTRTGEKIIVRSIHPEDKMLLQELMKHLSPESKYFRFLAPKVELSAEELVFFTELNSENHIALVAFLLKDFKELPVGTARYILSDLANSPSTAEIAFTVQDEFQGIGIASCLLRYLVILGTNVGLHKFTALVHPENTKMLRVFQNSGLPMTKTRNQSSIEITLALPVAI